MLRYYTGQHQYYCGVDLHARTMYLCVVNQQDEILLHREIPTDADRFLAQLAPYRTDVVVCVECIFTWYWVADLCAAEGIPFVLGHALEMKAISGSKTKNDRIDSRKIAKLLRGGMIPMAYVYPRPMRSTRDLLRRRMRFVQQRAELLTHIQQTNAQYNLPKIGKTLKYKANRTGVAERFEDASVRKTVEVDLALIAALETTIQQIEAHILATAKAHDPMALQILRTTRDWQDPVPGAGLRDSDDHPVSEGAAVRLLRPVDSASQGIRRKTHRARQWQNGQCLSQMGLFRSDCVILAGNPGLSAVYPTGRAQIWQGQSQRDSGPSSRAGGLFHVKTPTGL